MRINFLSGLISIVYSILVLASCNQIASKPVELSSDLTARKVWSAEKANSWYSRQKWIVGADFIPSTAINQLEMWQAETFDSTTISRELQWASQIGMNTMRVYLHHKAWEADKAGFIGRLDQYLTIANSYGIKTIFVFFDDCWNKDPKTGTQPAPKPGVHNSGWMQDPGDPYSKDSTLFPLLESYVKAIMGYFKNDARILLWDLYNEPGNSGKGDSSFPLLTNVFRWAEEANPDQPVSVGIYDWSLEKFNQLILSHSDVITYHDYEEEPMHRRTIEVLKANGKPLICTEYMARTRNSKFENILPLLKEKNVGAINWGLVAGKTNTIYAWDTPMPDGKEPKIWFHDIFRKDGSAFDPEETELIKTLTGTK
ncbi:cellulase family glycosylhydrolase [Flavihumibacter profundi]|uniref:cellulase family glycosylhydrolase n=1 Tax=Flavihumibacter profundi TaxID=2716883 RepID=UPI001CC798BB|nr:cellulase family glycosylhydrolase [Flavihumibacter profundi]MBZ5859518.1 glycoside hydrolase family 5 protein [Flavihumibacter profundi]